MCIGAGAEYWGAAGRGGAEKLLLELDAGAAEAAGFGRGAAEAAERGAGEETQGENNKKDSSRQQLGASSARLPTHRLRKHAYKDYLCPFLVTQAAYCCDEPLPSAEYLRVRERPMVFFLVEFCLRQNEYTRASELMRI